MASKKAAGCLDAFLSASSDVSLGFDFEPAPMICVGHLSLCIPEGRIFVDCPLDMTDLAGLGERRRLPFGVIVGDGLRDVFDARDVLLRLVA